MKPLPRKSSRSRTRPAGRKSGKVLTVATVWNPLIRRFLINVRGHMVEQVASESAWQHEYLIHQNMALLFELVQDTS